ncbi:hypothetical protein IW261DRAFT_1562480 [Armillaria novae-zelandiae]|uniref:Uncharacterized protein n=1 Tax=Armillaria novae-zelandiae TaxID=153914 RepID=A0AA39PEJ2_9AGAR|nr:hypothetical protein IW261DRAFT_1562480 [Armillaria novae-zelandiae]
MSAGARLSSKTIETIVGLLASNFNALKSCSLVSRAFCSPTRTYLFRNIRGIHIKLEMSTDPVDIIQSISPHVRVIRLSNDDLLNDHMPRIISNFSYLDTITVLGYVDWLSLPEEIVATISSRTTVSSLNLYSIAFKDLDQFGHLIQSFPSLTSLLLFDIRFRDPTNKKPDGDLGCKPSLEHLTVYGSAVLPIFLTTPTSPISLQRLNKFTMMEVFAADFVRVAMLMELAQSIRELHFRNIIWRAPDPLDLFGVQIISLVLHESDGDGESLHYLSPELILSWWLRTFESGLELKSVTLKIFIQSRSNSLFNVELWEKFDTVMVDLRALEDVNIVIRGPGMLRIMLGKHIEEHCDGLRSSNVLKVDTRR